SFVVRPGFLSHLRSFNGYDGPEFLPSSTRPFCLTGADAGHPTNTRNRGYVSLGSAPSLQGVERTRDRHLGSWRQLCQEFRLDRGVYKVDPEKDHVVIEPRPFIDPEQLDARDVTSPVEGSIWQGCEVGRYDIHELLTRVHLLVHLGVSQRNLKLVRC